MAMPSRFLVEAEAANQSFGEPEGLLPEPPITVTRAWARTEIGVASNICHAVSRR